MSVIESGSEKEKQVQKPATPDTQKFPKKTGNREHKKFLKEYKIETSPYVIYRAIPRFKKRFIAMVKTDRENFYNSYKKKYENKDLSDERTIIEVDPSDLAICNRIVGYKILGQKPKEEINIDREWRAAVGKELHKLDEKIMTRGIEGDTAKGNKKYELKVTLKGGIKLVAKADILIKNHILVIESQIYNFKNVAWYPMVESNRDERYKGIKNLYQVKPEDEDQLLIYLYMANHPQNKINAPVASVIFTIAAKFATKEGIVVLDEKGKQRTTNLLGNFQTCAREYIRKYKLPPPTVKDKKAWCTKESGRCNFTHVCPYAEYPDKKGSRRTDLTPQQKAIIAKERAKKKEIADKMGITQPNLPGLDPTFPQTP